MNVEEVYLSWETPGPGVSHEADDPLNSAHRHPNKETRTKTEYGRQSGRVVTTPNNYVRSAPSHRKTQPFFQPKRGVTKSTNRDKRNH